MGLYRIRGILCNIYYVQDITSIEDTDHIMITFPVARRDLSEETYFLSTLGFGPTTVDGSIPLFSSPQGLSASGDHFCNVISRSFLSDFR